MSRAGSNTRRFLEQLDGPPSTDDMKDLAFALSWDVDVEWLMRTSTMMVEHWLRRDARDRDAAWEKHGEFSWWLGVRGMSTSMKNACEFRREMRAQSRRTKEQR